MAVTYDITSTDIKNLAKVLRKVDPELAKNMRRRVRESAKPVITDMRSQIGGNAMTAYGGGPHAYDGPGGAGGITAKMQRNIRLRVSGGRVRIYVPAAGSIGKIAASIDAGKAWRHPVMGNRKAWVSQTGSASGWFSDTGRKHLPQIREKVREALDETARDIAARL